MPSAKITRRYLLLSILIFIIAFFIGGASLLTVLFVKEPPIRSEKPPQFNPVPAVLSVLKFGFCNRRRILICVAFGCVACGLNLIMVYVPLQAKVNLGLTEAEIGRYILQFGTITNALLVVVAGWVIDKMGVFKSMITGVLLLSVASLIGFSPTWVSTIFGNMLEVKLSPLVFLAVAYTVGFVASPFVYMASTVYIMKSVHRTDFATFCACTGTANLIMQSIIMVLAGILIKHTGGNYGITFVMSIILVTVGIILFRSIMLTTSKELNIDDVQIDVLNKQLSTKEVNVSST